MRVFLLEVNVQGDHRFFAASRSGGGASFLRFHNRRVFIPAILRLFQEGLKLNERGIQLSKEGGCYAFHFGEIDSDWKAAFKGRNQEGFRVKHLNNFRAFAVLQKKKIIQFDVHSFSIGGLS
jgi:hypothetical protein